MASRNGVFYNLSVSPWYTMRNGIRFYFSSETHYNRFKREVDKRERQLSNTMSQRIGCRIDMRVAASLQLYRQVETRGFYIVIPDDREDYGVEGVFATCLEQLELDGLTLRWLD